MKSRQGFGHAPASGGCVSIAGKKKLSQPQQRLIAARAEHMVAIHDLWRKRICVSTPNAFGRPPG